eukprot:m.434903 g.434903  ORF g.434903 m.434903 type:complete len:354 (+) comp21419_c0_seq71:627-1688(+)
MEYNGDSRSTQVGRKQHVFLREARSVAVAQHQQQKSPLEGDQSDTVDYRFEITLPDDIPASMVVSDGGLDKCEIRYSLVAKLWTFRGAGHAKSISRPMVHAQSKFFVISRKLPYTPGPLQRSDTIVSHVKSNIVTGYCCNGIKGTFTMRGAIMNGGCVQPNSVVRVQLDAKNGSTASVQYISATLFEHISWKGPHHNDRSLCIMHARDYCDREARRRFRRAKVKTRITRSASQRQSVEKQVDAELIKNLDAGNGVFFNLHCHGANYSYEGKLIRNRLEVVIKVKTKYGASNPILSLNVDCAEPEEYSEETLTPLAATVTPGADDTDVRDKTEANSIDRTADNKESHEFDITLV